MTSTVHVFQDPGTIKTDEINVSANSIKSEPESATSSETTATPDGSAQQSAVSISHLLNNVPALEQGFNRFGHSRQQ